MKIAIYYPWIHLKSGVERTILETVKRSRHKYVIYTNHFDRKNTFPEFRKLKVVELKKIPVNRSIRSVFLAATTIAFQKVNLTGFDKLVIHSEGLGDLFLLRNNHLPTICFCHTPLRPVFDPEYKKRAIGKRNPIKKTVYVLFSYVFSRLDSFLWKRYSYIFFNSKETLNRAKKGGLLNTKSKYSILHPGIDWEKIKPTWRFEKYFFVPGRIMWTKNIELAIDSFKLFLEISPNTNFRLVIAGNLDHKSKPYFKYLKRISNKYKNIMFIPNPSETKMKNLYKNAYAVICSSFNEDWGITAVEANAFGKPVVAANTGGFKESIKHTKSGILTPLNAKLFAKNMRLLADNLKFNKKMGRFARINSKGFTWSIFMSKFDKLTG